MIKLVEILKGALEKQASDIHFKAGRYPTYRIDGQLYQNTSFPIVTPQDTIDMMSIIATDKIQNRFKEKYEADFSYGIPKIGRFRVNCYMQRGSVALVMRSIPFEIPDIGSLNLPGIIKKIAVIHRGLILVTGTTGSGKSTTLAAMIKYINESQPLNIITIEDPIEFLHRDNVSNISQREVGADTTSFVEAMKHSLRQDPDVILLGEMRDVETVETALLAAETGHLVMSTLHTLDAKETINRVISIFPPYHQNNIRHQLASVLKAVVSLRLMPQADGKGRVPAVEVLINTETIKECIQDQDKAVKIIDHMEAGKSIYGSQTFDQSILEQYQKGLITMEEALKWVTSPDNFKLKISGIVGTQSEKWKADKQ